MFYNLALLSRNCTQLAPAFLALILIVASSGPEVVQAQSTTTQAASSDTATQRDAVVKLLKSNCFDCHGNGESEGSLQLDKLLEQTDTPESRSRWWKVLSNVRAGTMPPPDSGYVLAGDEAATVLEWLKYSAMAIDPLQPDPGRPTVRRLSRREYANSIRDLMGIDYNADVMFPPDDSGYGFDNIGDAQSLSLMILEKYLTAAKEIVDKAVPTVCKVIPRQGFKSTDFRGSSKSRNGDNMRLDKTHNVSRKFSVDEDGTYQVAIELKQHGSFQFNPQRTHLKIELDGDTLHEAEYGWDESKRNKLSFTVDWQAGEHELRFILEPLKLPAEAKVEADSYAEVDVEAVAVEGPSDRAKWKHPAGYERFFDRDEPPTEVTELREYASQTLRRFALRTFRRPADESTLNKLVDLAEQIYSQPNATFEAGIAHAMIPMLASPRFLFRTDKIDPTSAGEKYPLIDEFSLATRLSYFLWSTTPDDELLKLAEAKQLRENLDQQIKRMLNDPRSNSLAENFVGQWLRTRDVSKTSIDPLEALGLQPEYDELRAEFRGRQFRTKSPSEMPTKEEAKRLARFQELYEKRTLLDAETRSAMRRETELLFETIFRENRSLLDMINPNFTFVNEKLAALYDIPGIDGKEMQRVELPAGSPRGGILAQGTMLVVTSNPTRTSPVKRGLFVLENILGTPTPPAPPNVPALEDSAGKFGDRTPSIREVLALHRESALCSSCHSRMDPLGLALENFNALGMYRDADNGQPIDAAGQLITGEKFKNLQELKQVIAGPRRADFYRCFIQKLMIYAVGRGLEYYDEHVIDELVLAAENNDGRLKSIVHDVIMSAPFQRLRPSDSPSTLAGE